MTQSTDHIPDPARHIRRALWINAAVCTVSAVLLILFAAPLSARLGWTSMPIGGLRGQAALSGFGLILLPLAALGAFAAAYRPFIRPLGWLFTGLDIGWFFLCWVALLFGIPLTTLGTTVIAVQATAVFALGLYEWWGMRALRAE